MVLGTHFTRASDVITPDHLTTSPSVPISPYRDIFGNWCSRIVAPAGRMRLSANGVVRDNGLPDVVVSSAFQHAVEDLPPETLIFLWAVATARPTACPRWSGASLKNRRPDGRASRRSAISCIATLRRQDRLRTYARGPHGGDRRPQGMAGGVRLAGSRAKVFVPAKAGTQTTAAGRRRCEAAARSPARADGRLGGVPRGRAGRERHSAASSRGTVTVTSSTGRMSIFFSGPQCRVRRTASARL